MSDSHATPAGADLTLPAMRQMRVVNGVLVLAMGLSLFGLSESTDRTFAWTVASALTAATLGAMYLAAAVREFLDARQQRWSHSRAAVPGVIVFSILMLITTLLHLDRFHFNSPIVTAAFTAWAWTIVYILVPIGLAWFWVRQMRRARGVGTDTQAPEPLPRWMRAIVCLIAITQVMLGVVMLVAPQAIMPAWPWPLTPLTARALGSWWVGIGIVLGGVARENDVRRTFSNFVFLFVLGALQVVALARYQHEFAWGTAGAWLYLAWLALALALGGYGAVTGAPRMRRASTVPNH